MADDIVDRILTRPNDAPMATERLLDEAADEIKRLRRLAGDWRYMADAYRNMLGEKGNAVAAMWDRRGVKRIHFDWGPEAGKMTGEERADFILALERVPKRRVDRIDTSRKKKGPPKSDGPVRR